MKHELKITLLIAVLFLITQLIGLGVVYYYISDSHILPYGMEPPQETTTLCSNMQECLISSLILSVSFALIILLMVFLIKLKSIRIMKYWFFIIVIIGLGTTFSVVFSELGLEYYVSTIPILSTLIAIVLSYFKVFKKNLYVHNITEVMIYPGIAAIFASMFNLSFIIIFLILLSIYDMWAVWKSGLMQKIAKFQINKLGLLGGFLIVYSNKKMKDKIKLLKQRYKGKKIPGSIVKKYNLRVNLAILGGGDVIFPIIATGVFFKYTSSLLAAFLVMVGAFLALSCILLYGKKKKDYPAIPYLTTGIFAAMLLYYLFSLIF